MFGDIFFCRVDKAGSENDACHWLEVSSSFYCAPSIVDREIVSIMSVSTAY